MPGQPIDAIGDLIPNVGPVGIGSVINIPFYVTALGANSNGIPVLTLISKYPNPAGSNVTVSTLYPTQGILDK